MMSRAIDPVARGSAMAPAPPSALLQPKCACGATSGMSGQCKECQENRLQRTAAFAGVTGGLSISRPEDASELAADRIADAVTRTDPDTWSGGTGTTALVQRVPAAQQQTLSASAADRNGVERTLASGGEPLDYATRQFFEPRFGYDFGRVRVHRDGVAGESAKGLDARAYTVGEHVVFGPGQFRPERSDGRQLIAHELAHVVQQGVGAQPPPVLQRKPSKGEVTIAAEGECQAPRAIAVSAVLGARMVRTALDWFLYCSAGNDLILNSHLRANFGSDSKQTRTAVHRRLLQISASLERAQKGGLTFSCVDTKYPGCKNHVAEAQRGSNRIVLCPSWFEEFRDFGSNYGGYSLIHEAAHLAGAVEKNEVYQNKIYGGLTLGQCLQHTPVGSEPLNNADNYAWFVSCLVLPEGAEVFPGLTIKADSKNDGKEGRKE